MFLFVVLEDEKNVKEMYGYGKCFVMSGILAKMVRKVVSMVSVVSVSFLLISMT